MPDYQSSAVRHVWKMYFEGPWPLAIAFAGSSRRLVCGNQDGAILEWELPEVPTPGKVLGEDYKETDGFVPPQPKRSYVGHSNTVTHLVTTAEANQVWSSSLDRTLVVWDLNAPNSGEAEMILDGETRTRLSRYADEKKRREINEAPPAKMPTAGPAATLADHQDWIAALGASRNGQRVISGDDSGRVIVWDARSRQKVNSWQCPGVAWIAAVALSADGQTAAVSQYRRKGGDFNNYPAGLRIFKVADGSVQLDILATLYPKEKNPAYQYQYEYHEFVAEGLVALAFSPDGRLLAAGQGGEGGNGKIHLIETESGKVVRSIAGHKYGVTDLLFTADGKYLFTAGRDTRCRISRVEDGAEVALIGRERGGQFTDWLASIALSPDEQRLAAADIAGFVQVWDLC